MGLTHKRKWLDRKIMSKIYSIDRIEQIKNMTVDERIEENTKNIDPLQNTKYSSCLEY